MKRLLIVIALLCSTAFGSVAFVQSKSNETTSVTCVSGGVCIVPLAMTSAVTGGNFLWVVGRWGNSGAGAGTLSVADTAGNTFTQVTGSPIQDNTTAGNDQTFAFYAFNITGGTDTITVTNTGGGNHRFTAAAAEFSGVATASPVDVCTTNNSPTTANTSVTTGNFTTTATDLIVFTMDSTNTQTAGAAFSGFGSWTQLENTGNNGYAATDRAVGGYQLNVAAATYSGTVTLSVSSTWAAIGCGFKAAAGGATPKMFPAVY